MCIYIYIYTHTHTMQIDPTSLNGMILKTGN